MPSSDLARFWRALVLGGGGAFALLITACWLLDPLGVLRPVLGGPTLCAAGIKSGSAVSFAPLVAVARHPQSIVLGSSRVLNGFDTRALAALRGRAANLGVQGATIAEMHELLDLAQSRARLRRVIIGVDLGMVLLDDAPSRLTSVDAAASDTAIAYRHGLFGRDALLATLRNAHRCRAPPFGADGTLASWQPVPLRENAARIALRRSFVRIGRGDTPMSMTIERRLVELEALIADARAGGAKVSILLGPHRSQWRAAVAEAGFAAREARFREAVARLAQSQSARLIDADAPDFAARNALPRCADASNDCHFIDANHYAPNYAQAIARIAAE